MTELLLACAILTGAPPQYTGTLQLRIHLGKDRESAIIRSELARQQPYFLAKRLFVEANYRLIVDEDANDRPSYQFGRGGERTFFRPGSFRSSGCFMRALESIAEVDRYERECGDGWHAGPFGMIYDPQYRSEYSARKPVPWPSVPPPVPDEIPIDVLPDLPL